MNHRNGFNPLSRTTAHRRAMSRNMVTSLFRYERITTTKSKALEVRKSAEKLITRAKEDTVHNRREAAKFIQDEKILNKLFTEIGPRMKERNGGYTRVLKLGYRQGDAADVVILELGKHGSVAAVMTVDNKAPGVRIRFYAVSVIKEGTAGIIGFLVDVMLTIEVIVFSLNHRVIDQGVGNRDPADNVAVQLTDRLE